eukprot:XP_019925669.1 PREDICTED: carbohydrate sulfotransferase 15 isoform X2 [Crassostrea gigas]
MMETRYIQLCASMICIVLLTSLQLYIKEQTRISRTKLLPYVPNHIPTPVKEPNTTLCPQGRPKPTIDDILCMAPFTFNSSHKNPCWTSVNGKLKCLPYFQVIGMDKCGTTDLFARISRHPDVVPNIKNKETMWWSWERYGYWLWSSNARRTYLSNYIHYFNNLALRLNNISQKKGKTQLVTGDGTPMDMWDFRGWTMIPQNKGLKEPQYLTPHLIRHVNRDVKLLILLRNPVDRLYSDYYFIDNGERSKNRTTFHQAVVKAIDVLKKCQEHRSPRSCLFDFNLNAKLVKHKTRIHLGFYAVFLREWLSVFPRDQILIMRTEDYSANTKSVMKRVFDFLQLKSLKELELSKFKITTLKREYVTKHKLGKQPMLTKTRVILENLYRADTEELSRLLKDKRFLWISRDSKSGMVGNSTINQF